MGRRFLLVGLYVVWPYERGTIMQLSLACLSSTLFLVLHITAFPYKHMSDNLLAIGCSTALVTTLLGCILFHNSSLVDAEQVRSPDELPTSSI